MKTRVWLLLEVAGAGALFGLAAGTTLFRDASASAFAPPSPAAPTADARPLVPVTMHAATPTAPRRETDSGDIPDGLRRAGGRDAEAGRPTMQRFSDAIVAGVMANAARPPRTARTATADAADRAAEGSGWGWLADGVLSRSRNAEAAPAPGAAAPPALTRKSELSPADTALRRSATRGAEEASRTDPWKGVFDLLATPADSGANAERPGAATAPPGPRTDAGKGDVTADRTRRAPASPGVLPDGADARRTEGRPDKSPSDAWERPRESLRTPRGGSDLGEF